MMGIVSHWIKKAEVKRPEGTPAPNFLDNDDLRPLRLKDRTWGRLVWLMFWLSSASSVGNWQGVAAGIALGLSAWETLITIVCGRIILEFLIVANGRCGAIYHMPLPVIIRSSWGVYGAWWPVVNRIVMTVVFMGMIIAQGGFCVYVTLHAIFPSIGNLPDLSPSEGITVGQLIGILVFWLLVLAVNFVPVPKLKNTIYIKVVVFFGSAFALLGWCVHLGGGIGRTFTAPSRVHGSERSWLIARFLLLSISNSATFIMNAADWQRYSKRPNDPILMQLIGGPLAHCIINLIGGLVASSGALIFEKPQWNPVLLVDQILSSNYTPRIRAACFFLGLAFTYSTLISVVLQNSLPAGNDLAGLFPKYINYQRGTLISGLLCIAICPWRLIATANAFVAFLGNYGIFLSSFIGPMMIHYFLLTRGYINVEDLFTPSRTGSYYFWHGVNLRAVVAYVLGIAPSIYGFAGAVGAPASVGVLRSFYFSVVVGIIVSAGVYALLCAKWPVPHQVPFGERSWLEPADVTREEDVAYRSDVTSSAYEDMNTASTGELSNRDEKRQV